MQGSASVMGWAGKIRVNGTTYKWLGMDGSGTPANVTNVQVTPTRTIFVMQAGPMNVTITFLSPIEPNDLVKQSIPFSYVSVEAQSLDGNSYPVQVYSDISAEWASGDRSSQVRWSNSNTDTGNSIYHEIQLQSPQENTEIANQAQDGTVYYAMSTSQSRITWQIDLDATTRNAFQTNGVLGNSQSTAFASISPTFTVFALAVDLGTIQSTSSPITWSVGYVRDPTISYTTPSGAIQKRRPYYATQYSTINRVIDAFTSDYSAAHDRAVALDQKIMNAANSISSQYSDIVSLAMRQAMSSMEITVGTNSDGSVAPSDLKIFMKDTGTDHRVNPVEHVYAAFPMFLYLNATIGGALLEPLLESQVSLTGQQFAAVDIGNGYPAATGSEAVSTQGVEQSGNMLIMELAYARISGDGAFLSQYYNTSKRWADYLVSNALKSENQTNQDGDTSDLANIALKGIIGVKAMAEIAHALGENADAAEYGNQSSSLLSSWLSLATSSGGSRLLGSYGNQQSWTLMYNLFADKLLGLDFVAQSVLDTQTQYLGSLLATAPEFGLPIDSESGPFGNTAWTMFASAFMSDNNVRNNMISNIHNHVNSNTSAQIFPERYNTTDNSARNGFAGPALGGVFSHLALTVANQTISGGSLVGGSQSSKSGSSTPVGAIVGGVIGGLAVVGVAIFVIILRKRRRQQYEQGEKPELEEQEPHHPTLAGYYPHSPSSEYTPVARSDTTAGFAGVGTAEMGMGMGAGRCCQSSSKAREAALNRTHHYAPSVATSSNVGSQTGSASSRDPLSPRSGTGSGSISSTDVLGLRAEVENLRRVMQEIRAERLEPPPEYVEE
ncbi:hypothetical protein GSI_01539 [Ganoderma sinense ZZ0214-1]|uniref:DUF1793-domain-containing protein n=1 Tax=Ganoderma sinense ZZ0214-1 TaxID=1077348 RepID=A0A2G8SQ32_9APHY|nr:hypothetical protein GSI_01539 [Ganoderma sinense ZZ0214-1]